MSEDCKGSENKGPCVCGCYAHDHKDKKGVCSGWHISAEGKREDCDCKEFVPAVIISGYGAKNRQQDMIESVGHLVIHSMVMMIDSADDGDKERFGKLRDRLRELRREIASMNFAYGE